MAVSSIGGIGDKLLGAVQDIVVTHPLSRCLLAGCVGACARLGQGPTTNVFAGSELGQIFFLLRFCAKHVNGIAAQRYVSGIAQTSRTAGPANFFYSDDIASVISTGATIFSTNRQTEVAELA